MKNTKRYKFIFHEKGNVDLRGAKEVLIGFGLKAYRRVKNIKVTNKHIERINEKCNRKQ